MRTKSVRLIAMLMAQTCLLVGVFGASEATGRSTVVSHSFHDEYGAQIGSNGRSLFQFVNGSIEGEPGVWSRVLRFKEGRWTPVSPVWPSSTDSGTYLGLQETRSGRLPCVADTARSKVARVQCLGPSGWQRIALPPGTTWHYLIQGFTERNGSLFLPLRKSERTGDPKSPFRTTVKLTKITGERLSVQGPVLKFDRQASVRPETATAGTPRQPIRLSVTTQSDPTQQWIETLTASGWKRSGELPRLSGAKSFAGPVRDGLRTFMFSAETQLPEGEEFGGYLFRQSRPGQRWSEVGGQPVNVGEGSAQGAAFAVGGRVWAIWNQNEFKRAPFGGMIPTRIFAARLGPNGRDFDRMARLWKGRVVFPGAVQVIQHRSQVVALFMTQKSKQSGMHATIRFLASD